MAASDGAHFVGESTQKKPPFWRGLLEYLAIIIGVLIIMIPIKAYVVEPFEIPTTSMVPTIQVGDRIFAEKLSFKFNGYVEPGEIVTFKDPLGEDKTLIKRVIAVEGDIVDLRDGRLYVNDKVQDEPYTKGKPSDPLPQSVFEVSYPFVVPPGYIWVMGDNRTNSADSRFFGPIPFESVTGHAVVRYWPFDRLGLL